LSTNPRLATEVLEEAIEITQSRDPIGSSLAADSLAMAYAILGEFSKADKAVARSYALAERSGDPIAMIDAQIAQSQVEAERGNLEEAVRLSRDSATRASILGVTMCTLVGNYFAGSAELQLGRPALAVQPLQISRDMAESAEAGWFQNMAEAALSSTTCATGDLDAARAGWAKSLDLAARTNDIGSEATILLQRAVALATTPDPDLPAIAADLERAIEILERVGARPRQARARAEYAAILERMGRPDEAVEQRRLAQELLQAMGLRAAESSSPK
jgi:tetratricopeptide (TPR) repeat protein